MIPVIHPLQARFTMDDMHIARDDVERAAIARKGSPYLTTKQAAHYLGLSPRTLEKMRTKGIGPNYYRVGRGVRHLVRDLDAWAITNMSRRQNNTDRA